MDAKNPSSPLTRHPPTHLMSKEERDAHQEQVKLTVGKHRLSFSPYILTVLGTEQG